MLSLLSRNHPLAANRALQQALAELRGAEPVEALGEAGSWVESLLGNPDLNDADRHRLIFALDEATQPHVRQLAELFLATPVSEGATRRQLWNRARGFLALLLDAYGECLITAAAADDRARANPVFAELATRAIRTGCQRAKWDAFRHGPHDETLWARVNLAYRLAVGAGQDRLPIQLRADRRLETTAEREYVRCVALHVVGPDQLDPAQLELAARLITYVWPHLQLTGAPATGTTYWVEAAQSLPPSRLVRIPEHASLPRFFSGIEALPALQQLQDLLLAGNAPASLVADDDASRLRLAVVLGHMIKAWSSEAQVRRHRRHVLPGQMMVISGLVRFLGRLAGDGEVIVPRTWELRDASRQGVGAVAPLDGQDEVRVGALVGMHSLDGDRWRVGKIKRLWRTAENRGHVGVELLDGSPMAASADDGACAVRVLVLDPLKRGATVRIAVPVPGPRDGVPLYLLDHGRTAKLVPLSVLDRGSDYEIRAYLFAP